MLEPVNTVKAKMVEAPQNVLAINEAKIDLNRETIEKKKTETTKKAGNIQQTKQAKIERIAQAMDSYVQSIQRDLKIGVHQATGKIIVKVISETDGKIIREIPAEELLDLAAKVEEMMGLLVNEKA
jgi:flagellar protein FlaG